MRVLFLVVLALGLVSAMPAAPWQPTTALALSPDGREIATGGLSGEVLWRDSKTGEVLGVVEVPGGLPVVALAFPAGTPHLQVVVASGLAYEVSRDRLVPGPLVSVPPSLVPPWRRWRSQGPSMSGVRSPWGGAGNIEGHPSGQIVAWTPGGTRIAWQAHEAAVTGLVVSADGTLLYSCSFDGTLAVWSLPSGKNLLRL